MSLVNQNTQGLPLADDLQFHNDQVVICVNNHYERRWYFSITQAVRGLGWLTRGQARNGRWFPAGRVEVWRYDEAASVALMRATDKTYADELRKINGMREKNR